MAQSVDNSLYAIIGTISGVIIGWALSRASKYLDKRKDVDDFINGLSSEMHEIKILLTLLSFSFLSKAGIANKETIHWAVSMLEESKDQLNEGDKSMLERWKGFLKKEDFLKALPLIFSGDEKEGLPLNTIKTTFFESKINNLPSIDQSLRNLIVRIYRRINDFNQHAERYNTYFFKTFDSTISKENFKVIQKNINDSYRNIGEQAKLIVNDISKVQKGLLRTRAVENPGYIATIPF
jgi:hypothetical protein